MKGNFININYKENKKKIIRTYILLCPYLSLYFQTIIFSIPLAGSFNILSAVEFIT